MRWLALLLLTACHAPAASLRAVGALGNSGGAGPGLVRVGDVKCETGAVVDRDGCVWVSGGDRINRLGLSGALVESFGLEPAGARASCRKLALLGDALYFIGQSGGRNWLYRLERRSGAVARPLGPPLPRQPDDWWPPCLGAEPCDGRLLLAWETAPGQMGVYAADAASGALTALFSLPGRLPSGLVFDAARRLVYLGAQFPDAWAVDCRRLDGTRAAGDWPVPTTKTPAQPTAFEGRLSLAGGALWDAGHYGFLARCDLAAQVDPGRVVEWHHELTFPTQVGMVGGGPTQGLVIGTNMADAVYYAWWDTAERSLRLVRRLGALPHIASLNLSADGWVAVGTFRSTLWWRWDDDCDVPPRKAELHIATTGGYFAGEQMLACGAVYRLDDGQNKAPYPITFSRRPGDRNEARRGEPLALSRSITGFAVSASAGQPTGTAWAVDGPGRRLLRAKVSLASLAIDAATWQPAALDGVTLTTPTDLAALPDGKLLLADGGRVLCLAPQGDGLTLAWTLADGFGAAVRLASDGATLLVADTERHRVLAYDAETRAPLGQLGEPDKPGDDGGHLDRPMQVAVAGGRAVVADTGNQRVIRIRIDQ